MIDHQIILQTQGPIFNNSFLFNKFYKYVLQSLLGVLVFLLPLLMGVYFHPAWYIGASLSAFPVFFIFRSAFRKFSKLIEKQYDIEFFQLTPTSIVCLKKQTNKVIVAVQLDQINSLTIGKHFCKYFYRYKNKEKPKNIYSSFLPYLLIQYTNNNEKCIVTIPFSNYQDCNQWLVEIKKFRSDLPVQIIENQMDRINETQVMEYINKNNHSLDYNGNLETSIENFYLEKLESSHFNTGDLGIFKKQMNINKIKNPIRKRGIHWAGSLFLTVFLMIFSLIGFHYLLVNNWISDTNYFTPLLFSFFIGCYYFLVMKKMRWFYGIFFTVVHISIYFIGSALLSVIGSGTKAFAFTLFGTCLIYIPGIYLVHYLIRKLKIQMEIKEQRFYEELLKTNLNE